MTPPAAARPGSGPQPAGEAHSRQSSGSGTGSGRPCAATVPDGSTRPTQRAAPTGMSFFSDDLLHPVDHQHLLGHEPLEPGVLRFQVLQSPGVRHVHPAEAVAPAEERLLADVVLLAQRLDRCHARFGFPQDRDDLLVGETLLHEFSLSVEGRELTCRLAT